MIRFVSAVIACMFCQSSAHAQIAFSRDVLPILSDHCFQCHGPDAAARKAKLRLDERANAIEKLAIVPGKSAESELIARIVTHDPELIMPPIKKNKPLSPAQIDTLKKWIDQGANYDTHWAFLAPKRPVVPTMKHATFAIRNPIDAFVLNRAIAEKMEPSPEATKEQLIRRVTLDLTGLPPTIAEIDAFLADTSPDAYERVVDRLLMSPHYGERMAWDWLDASRYADTNGYQGDQERTMWPWRDWVIRAFNTNMPFDQFTIEQLSGDLLPTPTIEQKLATGFNRNHMINGEGGRIGEENRIEYVFDQSETMGTIWLGLTLNCCRCHDHKFDPIARKEYYQFFAYFNQTPVNGGGGNGQTAPLIEYPNASHEARRALAQKRYDALAAQIAPLEDPKEPNLPEPVVKALKSIPRNRNDQDFDALIKHFASKPEYTKLLAEVRIVNRTLDELLKQLPRVMVMEDMPKHRETFILTKGAYDKRETTVLPGTPASLPPLPKDATPNRLALAKWLVSPENPLTARVTVNRFWQTFFGTGFVKTSEDFGVQGERPSHPDLLDWLATEFIASGWNVKQMHRLIVTSSTYRQSSKVTPERKERDPENRLVARGPRLRLPSWMIRDQTLAVSGLWSDQLGGPSVKPYQPAGIWEEATFGTKSYRQDAGDALYRRSLYVYWRRIVGPTMFFDTANRQVCAVKNTITNTPLHALVTLNETVYIEAARNLAQRVLLSGTNDAERIELAFRLVTSRRPTPSELRILSELLAKQRKVFTDDPTAAAKLLKIGESPRNETIAVSEHAAWTVVCSMLLNLDEVLSKQ